MVASVVVDPFTIVRFGSIKLKIISPEQSFVTVTTHVVLVSVNPSNAVIVITLVPGCIAVINPVSETVAFSV